MKFRLLLLFLVLMPFVHLKASHLVGGDFELQHRQGNLYRLLLNLYFDEINGRPNARDSDISAKIYEKGTNVEVRTINMPLQSQTNLNYTNPECTTGLLITSRLIYSEDIFLEPQIFNHPAGYYVVWERCCRNDVINNIDDPGGAGQTYYLEFPAVTRNGQLFRNSSPVLSPPISDYACINEAFSYNFGATDPDGDVVTFELATPLNGYTGRGNASGTANPAPYAEINWLPGYGQHNQVMGDPGLAIDYNTGMLTVTPTVKGLFVFSVLYKEYRNGQKIGEVRRDFQLLVNDCPRNDKPSITAKAAGSPHLYQEGQVVNISRTSSRCFTLYLTDTDANERLAVSAVPVNFSRRGYVFSGQTIGNINRGGQKDTLIATLCLDKCFDTKGEINYLDVIVSDFGDNGCGLPKRDTVRVAMVVEPVPDLPPAIAFSVPQRIFEVYDGDVLTFDVTGTDPDNDPVELSVKGQGFTVSNQSIQFPGKRVNGQVTTPFSWQIDCKTTAAPVYQLEFTVTSYICGIELKKSELVEVRVLKRALQNNTISADQVVCYGDIPARLDGSLPTGGSGAFKYVWEVSTTDAQTGFTATAGRTQTYIPPPLTQTSWFRRTVISGSCDEILHTSEAIRVLVNPLPDLPSVEGESVCPGFPATLSVTSSGAGLNYHWFDQPTGGSMLHTGPVYQTVPLTQDRPYYVQVTNSNGCVSASRAVVTAGVLPSTADAGQDVTIIKGRYVELKGKGGLTYQWSPATGMKSVTDIPNPLVQPEVTTVYVLSVTTAAGCIYTETVTITVLEPISPKNAITPNEDGKNDEWFIDNIELYPHASIQVFTRWGAKVFESTGYEKRWDGTDNGRELPMGAYYYIILVGYDEKPITGSITLIR